MDGERRAGEQRVVMVGTSLALGRPREAEEEWVTTKKAVRKHSPLQKVQSGHKKIKSVPEDFSNDRF